MAAQCSNSDDTVVLPSLRGWEVPSKDKLGSLTLLRPIGSKGCFVAFLLHCCNIILLISMYYLDVWYKNFKFLYLMYIIKWCQLYSAKWFITFVTFNKVQWFYIVGSRSIYYSLLIVNVIQPDKKGYIYLISIWILGGHV